jgi:hypothetical protein
VSGVALRFGNRLRESGPAPLGCRVTDLSATADEGGIWEMYVNGIEGKWWFNNQQAVFNGISWESSGIYLTNFMIFGFNV